MNEDQPVIQKLIQYLIAGLIVTLATYGISALVCWSWWPAEESDRSAAGVALRVIFILVSVLTAIVDNVPEGFFDEE